MSQLLRNILFVAIIAVIPFAQATVYTWVDSEGETHFSDTPVEGAKEVDVQIHSEGASVARDQTMTEQSESKPKKHMKKGPSNNGEQMEPLLIPAEGEKSLDASIEEKNQQ